MSILELYEIFKQNPIITTDSRNCPENSLFFALKGEKFNGNHYAKDTIENGCSYAFVDEKEFADGKKIIYVENVLETLQKLANHHRKVLNTPIIGITGTNGKTTTKELIAAVLKKKYKTLYTQGNLNNHIGVPLTLLRLEEGHEIAIVEMGANHPGEIKTLVDIVEPNYGIITNVGKAHIEGFGSFEGVIKTKCELYDFLEKNGGAAFVNKGNDLLLAKTTKIEKVIEYGNGSEFSATIENNNPFLVLKWDDSTINTNLIGNYNAENIMASVAIGHSFKVDKKDIIDAIEGYIPQNNRSQFKETAHNKLIIDAYNANPTSMNAAIDNFNLIDGMSYDFLKELLEDDFVLERSKFVFITTNHKPGMGIISTKKLSDENYLDLTTIVPSLSMYPTLLDSFILIKLTVSAFDEETNKYIPITDANTNAITGNNIDLCFKLNIFLSNILLLSFSITPLPVITSTLLSELPKVTF